jgi:F-box protein 9
MYRPSYYLSDSQSRYLQHLPYYFFGLDEPGSEREENLLSFFIFQTFQVDPNTMEQTEAERELERFRQQWREEVSAKSNRPDRPKSSQASAGGTTTSKKNRSPVSTRRYSKGSHDGADELEPFDYHEVPEKETGRKTGDAEYGISKIPEEPTTALDHYEKAVEREGQGSLGDSVALYRKAFRMDPDVQDLFKKKHYSALSASAAKPANSNPSNAPVTVPNTAHHSLTALPPTVSELITNFTGLSIPGATAPTEFSPAPPCPISEIPDEILTHILLNLAIMDIASFARTAQVCKRLAYLVLTEDSIWKRIVHGPEYGLGGMHYKYACTEDGDPISAFSLDDTNTDFSLIDTAPMVEPESKIQPILSLTPQYPTYRIMLRHRPRLRFQGCYISTVNYTRPGHANSMRWNTPILIVTYYRYLRFYRDGTVISLLTTHEPTEVVPYLSKEYLHRETTTLPHGVMRDAVGGRWRLGGDPFSLSSSYSPLTHPTIMKTYEDGDLSEGHLHIETPGVVPKYMYKMHLSLQSAGKAGPRNNKLAFVGYWSKNRLTDDWGEFELKHDKAFYWSRVKSWVSA